jgi:hypothetical protein
MDSVGSEECEGLQRDDWAVLQEWGLLRRQVKGLHETALLPNASQERSGKVGGEVVANEQVIKLLFIRARGGVRYTFGDLNRAILWLAEPRQICSVKDIAQADIEWVDVRDESEEEDQNCEVDSTPKESQYHYRDANRDHWISREEVEVELREEVLDEQ